MCLVSDGTIRQLTRDHILVQELVDAAAISAECAAHHPHANVITRAVGADLESLVLDEVDGACSPVKSFSSAAIVFSKPHPTPYSQHCSSDEKELFSPRH